MEQALYPEKALIGYPIVDYKEIVDEEGALLEGSLEIVAGHLDYAEYAYKYFLGTLRHQPPWLALRSPQAPTMSSELTFQGCTRTQHKTGKCPRQLLVSVTPLGNSEFRRSWPADKFTVVVSVKDQTSGSLPSRHFLQVTVTRTEMMPPIDADTRLTTCYIGRRCLLRFTGPLKELSAQYFVRAVFENTTKNQTTTFPIALISRLDNWGRPLLPDQPRSYLPPEGQEQYQGGEQVEYYWTIPLGTDVGEYRIQVFSPPRGPDASVASSFMFRVTYPGEFHVGPWGPCTSPEGRGQTAGSCKEGYQQRDVVCLSNIFKGAVVPISVCTNLLQPPPSVRSCLHSCTFDFQYQPGPWRSCTADCGGGTQTRELHCLNSTGGVAPISRCISKGLDVPMTTRACGLVPCPDVVGATRLSFCRCEGDTWVYASDYQCNNPSGFPVRFSQARALCPTLFSREGLVSTPRLQCPLPPLNITLQDTSPPCAGLNQGKQFTLTIDSPPTCVVECKQHTFSSDLLPFEDFRAQLPQSAVCEKGEDLIIITELPVNVTKLQESPPSDDTKACLAPLLQVEQFMKSAAECYGQYCLQTMPHIQIGEWSQCYAYHANQEFAGFSYRAVKCFVGNTGELFHPRHCIGNYHPLSQGHHYCSTGCTILDPGTLVGLEIRPCTRPMERSRTFLEIDPEEDPVAFQYNPLLVLRQSGLDVVEECACNRDDDCSSPNQICVEGCCTCRPGTGGIECGTVLATSAALCQGKGLVSGDGTCCFGALSADGECCGDPVKYESDSSGKCCKIEDIDACG